MPVAPDPSPFRGHEPIGQGDMGRLEPQKRAGVLGDLGPKRLLRQGSARLALLLAARVLGHRHAEPGLVDQNIVELGDQVRSPAVPGECPIPRRSPRRIPHKNNGRSGGIGVLRVSHGQARDCR
jgi:hypothetical protein